jgi:hypothetical protein
VAASDTADVTALIPVIDRLRRRFAIARVCVVADRGMISAETVAELEARRLCHVFCSFLALVLKAALKDRIAALGRAGSWPEIVADLDSLTETEIEHEGKRFLRSGPRPAASLALRGPGSPCRPPSVPPRPPDPPRSEMYLRVDSCCRSAT